MGIRSIPGLSQVGMAEIIEKKEISEMKRTFEDLSFKMLP